MNCIEFEKRLNEQFGPSRLEERDDLAAHAEQCAACHSTLERFRLVSDALELWREQVPEVDLTGAIVSGYRAQAATLMSFTDENPLAVSRMPSAEHSPSLKPAALAGIVARPFSPALRGRAPRQMWLAAGSVAALVVATILIFRPRDDARQPLPQPQLATNTDHPGEVPTAKISEVHDSDNLFAEDRDSLPARQRAVYYDLAQKAAGALDEVSAFVMTGSAPPMSPSDAGAEEPERWIDGLQHQLQPIGRSLDDAFDFLWQAGQSADSSQS